MTDHAMFLWELRQAAQDKEDLLPILEREAEHLRHCPRCRSVAAKILGESLGEVEVLDLIMRLLEAPPEPSPWPDASAPQLPWPEAAGDQAIPAAPAFDLSFLTAAAVTQPAPVTQVPTALWNVTTHLAAEGVQNEVRELAMAGLHVRLERTSRRATFRGLADGLASSVTTSPVRRGRTHAQPPEREAPAEGQALSLPDQDAQVELTVTVNPSEAGRGSLVVSARPTGDSPLGPAEVELRFPGGVEVRRLKDGAVAFVDLEPGPYAIEVRLKDKNLPRRSWRFNITLEAD